MAGSIEKAVFAARARESGVPLTGEEIDHLFEGYRLLQRLVAALDPPVDVALEPALVFRPAGIP